MFVDFSKDIRYFADIIYKVFRWGFIKSTDHRPTDHRPTDHPPLTHRPTDQLTTDPIITDQTDKVLFQRFDQ